MKYNKFPAGSYALLIGVCWQHWYLISPVVQAANQALNAKFPRIDKYYSWHGFLLQNFNSCFQTSHAHSRGNENETKRKILFSVALSYSGNCCRVLGRHATVVAQSVTFCFVLWRHRFQIWAKIPAVLFEDFVFFSVRPGMYWNSTASFNIISCSLFSGGPIILHYSLWSELPTAPLKPINLIYICSFSFLA
jgi:hypothetical protein